MKINFYKLLEVIGIGLIITSGVIGIQIYFNEKYQECTSNPLVYASKVYEERFGYEFSGSGSFISYDKPINSPVIFFNSKEVKIDYPNDNIIELPTFFNP